MIAVIIGVILMLIIAFVIAANLISEKCEHKWVMDQEGNRNCSECGYIEEYRDPAEINDEWALYRSINK